MWWGGVRTTCGGGGEDYVHVCVGGGEDYMWGEEHSHSPHPPQHSPSPHPPNTRPHLILPNTHPPQHSPSPTHQVVFRMVHYFTEVLHDVV